MRTLVGLFILYLFAAWYFDFWPFANGSFRPLESFPFSLNQTAPPPSHPDHTVVGWSGAGPGGRRAGNEGRPPTRAFA